MISSDPHVPTMIQLTLNCCVFPRRCMSQSSCAVASIPTSWETISLSDLISWICGEEKKKRRTSGGQGGKEKPYQSLKCIHQGSGARWSLSWFCFFTILSTYYQLCCMWLLNVVVVTYSAVRRNLHLTLQYSVLHTPFLPSSCRLGSTQFQPGVLVHPAYLAWRIEPIGDLFRHSNILYVERWLEFDQYIELILFKINYRNYCRE